MQTHVGPVFAPTLNLCEPICALLTYFSGLFFWCLPSPLTLTVLLSIPSPMVFPEILKEQPNRDLRFRLFTYYLALGLCINSHLLPEEVFLKKNSSEGTNLEYSRKLLEIIFLIFFFRSVFFGSILYLWALQSLVPGYPSNASVGFLSWSRPQVKLDIGWPLQQILYHYSPSTNEQAG